MRAVALASLLCLIATVTGPVLVPGAVPGAAAAPIASPTAAHAGGSETLSAPDARDPRRRLGLFVDPLMPAAQAAQSDATFAPIGKRAQALWITDYYAKPGAARDAVAAYSKRAVKAHKTPMLAIYNIPDRDCGLYSSGGAKNDRAYRRWIRQAALGMKGRHAIVVLEPDAVPFIGNDSCTGKGDRLGLLRYAAARLHAAGAWVYLDAGHSGWQTPKHMAPLLKKAGMKYARGFSTNVGNFRPMADEQAYAKALVRQLAKHGLKGRHYLIETARNGAGANGPANGDVCNPTAARVGKPPKLVFDGAFDGRIWIKHPGESDGPCNGGPNSGEWWPNGARRLLGLPDQ